MIEHNIGPEQLYNADETGLYWKMMPSKTLASASENKAASFKKVKDSVSILACTNAAGTHKLPLLLIGKSQKPRCFKHVNLDRLPVIYRAQNNTWMTATIFQEWFKNMFVPNVKTHLGSLSLPLRALLLIDNCPVHPPDLTVDTVDGAIECRFLPANTTSHFQPMAQGPLEVMKRHYRKHLIQNLVSDPSVPVNDAIKGVTLKDDISFIDKAWRCVTDGHIRKSRTKSTLTDCFPSLPEARDELEPELDSISAKIYEALEVSQCEVKE